MNHEETVNTLAQECEAARLAVGTVINDVPSIRVDSMPYGGVKNSGLGREGIRFAMEDMTEIKLLVLNKLGRL